MNQNIAEQFLALSRKEPNARKRIRLLAVSLFYEGNSRTDIAKRLNIARSSVNKWVSSYLEQGLYGLDNKPIQGRPSRLQQSQLEQLSEFIKRTNTELQGGRLTGEDIVHYISTEFGVHYHLNHTYKILKQLGFSWITSRSKHPKHSLKSQEAFKKLPTGNDPSHTRTPST
ncbi:transposase [Pseudoalteromonas lipolytica SCSIO 04301]|nr:transposase [Pseudoalteromonas lipolytica SCSIO 04301]